MNSYGLIFDVDGVIADTERANAAVDRIVSSLDEMDLQTVVNLLKGD